MTRPEQLVAGPLGTVSYIYDAAGRRTRTTWPGAGLYVDYDYLVTGEVTKIRENGAISGASVLGTYAYDDRGRRTTLTRGNGTTSTYSYDNASRLSQLTENLSGTTHDQTLGFGYNQASQIVSNTRSNDAYAWGDHYDVLRSYLANGLNQYTTSGTVTPTYDARGNLTSAGSTTYAYTSENMLKSASNGSERKNRGYAGRTAHAFIKDRRLFHAAFGPGPGRKSLMQSIAGFGLLALALVPRGDASAQVAVASGNAELMTCNVGIVRTDVGDALPVRAGPGDHFARTGEIPHKYVVFVCDESREWLGVVYSSPAGWCSRETRWAGDETEGCRSGWVDERRVEIVTG